jgi:hypothetical protein
MSDDVSHERAWHELKTRAPGHVPLATLKTAEFLAQQKDAERAAAKVDPSYSSRGKSVRTGMEDMLAGERSSDCQR